VVEQLCSSVWSSARCGCSSLMSSSTTTNKTSGAAQTNKQANKNKIPNKKIRIKTNKQTKNKKKRLKKNTPHLGKLHVLWLCEGNPVVIHDVPGRRFDHCVHDLERSVDCPVGRHGDHLLRSHACTGVSFVVKRVSRSIYIIESDKGFLTTSFSYVMCSSFDHQNRNKREACR
jgi:hypothetical protein